MADPDTAHPPEIELSLAYTAPEDRAAWAGFFALDAALRRAVAGASEPIVGQLRLAWWRDALGAGVDARPRGNPQLDDLADAFGTALQDLVPLVDGWEALLLADPLDRAAVTAFAQGRVAGLRAIASVCGVVPSASLDTAAQAWALADLAQGLADEGERRLACDCAEAIPFVRDTLPLRLRPLAVLAALGRAALRRGGGPLMAGRTSALVALRAGLFGR